MDDTQKMAYFMRAYSDKKVAMEHFKNPSEYDQKMIRVLPKIYKHYETHTNRRTIMKIEDSEARELIYKVHGIGGRNANKVKEVKTKNPDAKEKKKEANLVKTITCPATKMDGEICGCKVKPNMNFCGRHCPK